MNSNARRIMRVYFVRVASVLLSFGFSILAARLLGVELFGDYAALMAVLGLFAVAAGGGVPQLLERELAAARGSASTERLVIVLQGVVILAVISVLCLPIVAIAFGKIGIAVHLVISTSLAASIAAACLNGLEMVEESAFLMGIIRSFFAIILLLLMSFAINKSVVGAMTAQIIAAAAAATMALWAIKRARSEILCQASSGLYSLRSGPMYKSLGKAGFHFLLIQILINTMQQSEILWLKALSTPENVAHFFAASRAGNGVSLLHASILAISAPRIVYFHGMMDTAMRDHEVLQASRSSFLATILLSVAALLVSDYYLSLYGDSFVDAKPSLMVIMFGCLMISSLGPVVTLMTTIGKERDVWVGIAIGIFGGGFAANMFIPELGVLGAAFSFNVMILLYHIYMLPILRRSVGYIPFCGMRL